MRRWLIVLVVLFGLLIVLDRVAVAVANRAVAEQVRTELELQQDVDVSIHGFPFLLQALRGRYDDVSVRIPEVDAEPFQNLEVDARLRGVRVPLAEVIGRSLDRVPVDRIGGTVTIGYEDLARASGVPGLTIRPDGDRLAVTGTVQVPGRSVPASARGRIGVEGGDLVVTPEEVQVDGVESTPVVRSAASRLLTFRVSPRDLPLGLRITSVQVEPDGLRVAAESEQTVLSPDTVR